MSKPKKASPPKDQDDRRDVWRLHKLEDYHDDDKDVIWWYAPRGKFSEPPRHVGTPGDSDWPFDDADRPDLYWSPLPLPAIDGAAGPWHPHLQAYDKSIHANPDAAAWAKVFMETFPEQPKRVEETMRGWFANAMMAQHDHVTRLLGEQAARKRPQSTISPAGDLREQNEELRLLAAQKAAEALAFSMALQSVSVLAQRYVEQPFSPKAEAALKKVLDNTRDRITEAAVKMREVEHLVNMQQQAVHERTVLFCGLSKVWPAWLSRDEQYDEDKSRRWVVFVELPTGLVWFRIHDQERDWFLHLDLRRYEPDDSSEDERMARVLELEARIRQ